LKKRAYKELETHLIGEEGTLTGRAFAASPRFSNKKPRANQPEVCICIV
jgi:hypothetical protein